jgi:predicted AlkP superfamily pyrophosphatase or phosphodiesterase
MLRRLWIVSVLLTSCLLSNIGHSAEVEPTVILVSLDAFRWDYAERAATPALDSIAATGVRAKGLIPVFPSKTFPNHYSIVTGLYPDNHGVISNVFYDRTWKITLVGWRANLGNRGEAGPDNSHSLLAGL